MLAAFLFLSIPSSAFGEIRLDATILPETDNTFQTIITVNSDALGFLFPTQSNLYYLLYWDDLPFILSQIRGGTASSALLWGYRKLPAGRPARR